MYDPSSSDIQTLPKSGIVGVFYHTQIKKDILKNNYY